MGVGCAGGAVHGDADAARVEMFAAEEEEGFALLVREIAQRAYEGYVFGAGIREHLDEAIIGGFGGEAGVFAGAEDGVVQEPVGGFGFVRGMIHSSFFLGAFAPLREAFFAGGCQLPANQKH